DLVLERVALLAPLRAELQHLAQAMAETRGGVGLETPARHPLQGLPLAARRVAPRMSDGMHEDIEAPFGDDARVEVLHGAGRGVARVGEDLLAAFFALAVDLLEPRPRQEYLAPHLELARHVLADEHEGHGADGPHVRRHVVAANPVATCHAAD